MVDLLWESIGMPNNVEMRGVTMSLKNLTTGSGRSHIKRKVSRLTAFERFKPILAPDAAFFHTTPARGAVSSRRAKTD